MNIDRRFLPGDEVKLLMALEGSGGEKTGEISGTIHNGSVDVIFPNGNIVNVRVSDLTRIDR